MAVSVTNSSMTDFNTITTLTVNAATAEGANGTEAFTFTPTRADHRCILIMDNQATDQGTVTYSIAAGGFPQAGAALTGSVAQGVLRAIVLDAKYKSASGTYVITFTPATGKILLTNHAFRCYCLELPF